MFGFSEIDIDVVDKIIENIDIIFNASYLLNSFQIWNEDIC